MKTLGALVPLRPAHRTDKDPVGHSLAVRQEDLRATPLDVRLMSVARCEIWKGRLRPYPSTTLERATIASAVGVRGAFRPLRRAFGTAEPALGLVEATPLDDPILATVREDDALFAHDGVPFNNQHRSAFC